MLTQAADFAFVEHRHFVVADLGQQLVDALLQLRIVVTLANQQRVNPARRQQRIAESSGLDLSVDDRCTLAGLQFVPARFCFERNGRTWRCDNLPRSLG